MQAMPRRSFLQEPVMCRYFAMPTPGNDREAIDRHRRGAALSLLPPASRPPRRRVRALRLVARVMLSYTRSLGLSMTVFQAGAAPALIV